MPKKPPTPLPEPPLMVLAKIKAKGQKPRWFILVPTKHGPRFQAPAMHAWFMAGKLRVVEHERNDAEAVAIIQGAKK